MCLLKAYLHYQELYCQCLAHCKAGLLHKFSKTNGLLSNLSDLSSIDTDSESASSSDTADNSESSTTRSCSWSNILGSGWRSSGGLSGSSLARSLSYSGE